MEPMVVLFGVQLAEDGIESIKRLIRQPTNSPEQMAGRDLLKINLSAKALVWTSRPIKKRPVGRFGDKS